MNVSFHHICIHVAPCEHHYGDLQVKRCTKKKKAFTFQPNIFLVSALRLRLLFTYKTSTQISLGCSCREWDRWRIQWNYMGQNWLYRAGEQGHYVEDKDFFLWGSCWLISEASRLRSIISIKHWDWKEQLIITTRGKNSQRDRSWIYRVWTRRLQTSRWHWHSTFSLRSFFCFFLLWWDLHLPAGRQRDTILFHSSCKVMNAAFPWSLISSYTVTRSAPLHFDICEHISRAMWQRL